MQKEYPTVGVDGEPLTLRRDSDVRIAFEGHSGITEGDSVGEYVVETMDCELDYNTRTEEDVLRVYVYLEPVTPDDMMASVDEDALTVKGWERVSYMTGRGSFGVVYEAEDWVLLN